MYPSAHKQGHDPSQGGGGGGGGGGQNNFQGRTESPPCPPLKKTDEL